ncbi:CHAT domain-containing protein [Catellatospora sp. NPDC049609]|uniref:CHAT domain-containing protein n=1 Tax=Catellatospora sp. NPDC049609 TaxID=3155505 RepID=UPI00343057AA
MADRSLDRIADAEEAADARVALAREWDELVLRARELPEFADFLRPLQLKDLLAAAEDGPVVVVNVSRWQCDALIVQAGGVTTCALPDLKADDAAARADHYLNTLQAGEVAAEARDAARRRRGSAATMAERQAAQRAERAVAEATRTIETMLADLLGWLWDAIAEPVLRNLKILDAPADLALLPRIWWCPTGPLTFLPIHAAGHHAGTSKTPSSVMDVAVSSYTPTLRALMQARRPQTRNEPGTDRLLVVGLRDTPGQRELTGVDKELDALAALTPPHLRTQLVGPAATRESVRQLLRTHQWVHFSCHGNQELDDPSQGGLALHDGVLSIADVTTEQFHAEFAGLSACKTATGGRHLPDEAITLAAALHYTGYRHVIATLWSVYDSDSTTDLFGAIYRDLIVDGRLHAERSARALHRAVLELRDAQPGQPSAWTPFTHTGP